MVYRLDAVDAYEKRLVKQIEIASATVVDAFNKPYVRLISVSSRKGGLSARVEVDVKSARGVMRQQITVQDGTDLQDATGRAVYADCRIAEIRAEKGRQFVELRVPGANPFLGPGEAWGDVDHLVVQREMIRRTIREHLEKERRLRQQGIKVLSLFFVDAVEKYRKYDAEGNPVKGEYALIFEEEYLRLAKHPDFVSLFAGTDLSRTAEEAHGGYFSIDRKKVGSRTIEIYKDTGGETQADDDTYSLIMRDKEKLLSLETPLKFVFSHSALREGWDNPNVFQICTLRGIRTERERRQTIGRGLRLCVNQAGDRVRGFDVNTLTIMAGESYEEFASNLQREIEVDTGIRFGVVEPHQFAAIVVTADDGATGPLGFEASHALWEHLREIGYIDESGKIQDSLRLALRDGTLMLPEAVTRQAAQIMSILRKLAGRLDIRNADDRRAVKPRRAVLDSQEFRQLWDRIKHKTTYRLQFDNERLIFNCIKGIREAPPVPKTRLQWRTANLLIGEAGVQALGTTGDSIVVLDERDIELPDVLTELQDRTQLTRRSIHRILGACDRLRDFVVNPQAFIDVAAETINRQKQLAIVDGIKYQRLGDEYYYAQELFETQELSGYLTANLQDASKSVYEQVVYESGIEAAFADELEKNPAIKVYAKLPRWFSVPTPLGSYIPDWAVLVQTDEGDRVYLVVETKAGLYLDDLRDTEKAKVACGREHFSALATGNDPACYKLARKLDDVLADL
jgi:type III restriction enzyme